MSKTLKINTARLLQDLKHLAGFGQCGSGVNRRSLTGEDLEARHWLCGRMQQAGLEAFIDGAGTVIGKTPHAKRLVIGSHTDTVPQGGWLDGAMGVIYGVEVARALMESPDRYDIGIEVISFIDEEGRFSPMLGSRIFCEEVQENEFDNLDSVDADGISFRKALQQANLDKRSVQKLDANVHMGYLEAHIEQGPVLEATGDRVGAVKGIVGASEFKVQFKGQSNHAGTTPMSMRKDALAMLFEFRNRFNDFCHGNAGPDTVWTFSGVMSQPKASNVIPNYAECSIQYRDVSSEILKCLDEGLEECCRRLSDNTGIIISYHKTVDMAPTLMESSYVEQIESAAEVLGVSTRRMPSGAGHDAMVMGRYLPSAMLFIPSIAGLSHNTEENSSLVDICSGAEVFALAVSKILQSNE